MPLCVSALCLLRNRSLNIHFPAVLSRRILAVNFLTQSQKFFQTSVSTKYVSPINMYEDRAVPIDMWSKEAVEVISKLNKLTEEGKGWTKYRPLFQGEDGSRGFLITLDERGKGVEYAIFCNPSLRSSRAVVQFGIYTRGTPGNVHGGAILSVLDTCMGVLADECGFNGLTGNLNIDFKRAIPLNTTTVVEATLDKVEGRKVFTSAAIKTWDSNETYAKCTAIFIANMQSKL